MPMQTMLMRLARVLTPIVAATAIAAVVSSAHPVAQSPVRVRVQTELGDIVMEIDAKRAPNTAANFLRYLNAGHYDGGTFHRTVKMDNQPDSPVKIEVIQAGVNPDRAKEGFPPILL
jgi:peptidyl-prolyl cis-trans isomerase A (cyclophilin A)